MDGFSYYNIFDTKGIEYLAIIAFLVLLIPFWVFLNKPAIAEREITKVLAGLTFNRLRIPQGLFYCNNHTWAHLETSGVVKVGIDDLLLHITGEVTLIHRKNPGEEIKKGELMSELHHDGKSLRIYSPVTGRILKINESVVDDPAVLSDDPYGKGWVCKLKPEKWIRETSTFFLAEDATSWTAKELERIREFLAGSARKYSQLPAMPILQDGGELCDHTLSGLPSEIWEDFQQTFLNGTTK